MDSMESRQHLEQLYREAIYEVDLPAGPVAFQVGAALPPALPVPLALVTAWNPGNERPGEPANRAANRRLEAELARRGLPFFPARGRDEAGAHVEPSFAIVGILREDALALARSFGQAAIVCAVAGRAELLWCEAGPAASA